MKLILQRVVHASVCVEDRVVGSIQKGIVCFVGIGKDDTIPEDLDYCVRKLLVRFLRPSSLFKKVLENTFLGR